MSQIKQFELIGVGSDVQFGKGGNRLQSASGAMSLVGSNGSTLANLFISDPTVATHAATKNYVDSVAQGLSVKESVAVATTANITLSGTQTIDTYAVQAGDRVLVKNQTDQTQNGIYVAATGAWARSSDASVGSELAGAFVFVEAQTSATQSNTGWVCTTVPPITIGTSNITWTQFSGAGAYAAGAGLTLSGTLFSANTDGSTIYVDGSNNLAVKSSATAGQILRSNGLSTTPTWGALDLSNSNAVVNTLAVANGGTGHSTLTSKGVLVGNGTSALTVTAAGSQYNVLTVDGSNNPVFGSIDLSQSAAVGSSILGLANGGSNHNNSSAAAGSVAYFDGTHLTSNSAGTTTTQVLTSGVGAAPTFTEIATLAVTGAANLGSGQGMVYSSLSSGTLNLNTIDSVDNKITVNTNNTSHEITLQVNQGNLDINQIGGSPLSVTHGGTGLSSVASGNIIYTTALNTFAAAPITSFGLSLLDDANQAAAQTTLGLTIGTNVEAWSASLDALAALSGTGFISQTGANTFAERSIVLDSANNRLGLSISNGSGVSGNPTIGLAINTLTAFGATATATQQVPVYDPTSATNVTLTMQEIADFVAAAETDPLFRYASVTTSTANIGAVLPANARVTRVMIDVTTAYTSGANMAINAAGGLTALATNSDIDLQTTGSYMIALSGATISTGQISATITGSPSAGASVVTVEYKIAA